MARLRYVAKRTLLLLVTLWGVSLLLFLILHALPSSPGQLMLGEGATPDQVAAVNHQLGYDRPLVEQYLTYLGGLLHGDLGTSSLFKRPVVTELAVALPVTLKLSLYALVLDILVTVPLAAIAATRRNGFLDHAIRAIPLVGIGMPPFWTGTILAVVFAVALKILPAGGVGHGFTGNLESLFLPALTQTIVASSILIRSLRQSIIDVLDSEYVMTARAKGVRGIRLVIGHVLPNAVVPTLSLLSVLFAGLIGGVLITESVFALPGIGSMVVQAFHVYDIPLVSGITLVTAAMILVLNLLLDVLISLLDPRVVLR
jgi:peptide/nickel transport system permease protein